MKWNSPKNRASIVGHKTVKPKPAQVREVLPRYGIEEEDKDQLRRWNPENYSTDDQQMYILDLLIENGQMLQVDITTQMAVDLGMKRTHAQSVVSAALLKFRQEGWIELLDKEGRSKLWRMIS